MTTTAIPDSRTLPGAPAAPHRWPTRLWGILAVLSLVLFLDGLDVSMVGVALPSIGRALGLTTSSLQWIVSGYVLGYGGLLLLGGRTADLLGRRRVFLIALAVFAVASLLGGLVDSGPLLIATRFIKGVSAAFTAPTGLSIITTTFAEGRARNKALSIYTVFGASGYSFGLIFGGLMTGLGWRWTFLMPVPIALIALVAGLSLIPRDRPASEGGHDVLGALTSTTAMLLLVYDLVSAPDRGWTAPVTLVLFGAVVVLLGAFLLVERRVWHPLVRLGILRKGTLVRANLGIVALLGSYTSFQFVVTLYLQSVLGWAPLTMALALLPAGLLVVLSAPFTGSMIDRFGTARFIVGGLIAMSAGYLLFLRVDTHPVYALAILPTVLLLGSGFALGFPSINVQATAGVEDDEQGLAAGLVQTAGQVGSALVLAVTTALITGDDTTPQSHSAAAMLAQYRPGLVFVTAVAVGGLLISLVPLLRRQAARHGTPSRAAAAQRSTPAARPGDHG
ncbi:MFS transporter [Actinoallomurus rhizosphaericola]|uniref:MFS transporter n=1 Tax=Actinoallomurus rhizosphaericola TaxID=2952536 RepID=UPI002091E5D3|nr:MFS transporter [Actinoallomurus rhizosphaericola]MCO5997180.1 MFS transporter [Actinoallomurus rhizosphaericola]